MPSDLHRKIILPLLHFLRGTPFFLVQPVLHPRITLISNQSSIPVINVRSPSKKDLHCPLLEAKYLGYGFLTTGRNTYCYQTVRFPTFWFFCLGWSLFQPAFYLFLVLTDSIKQLHNWKRYITRTFSAFGSLHSNITKGPPITVGAVNSFKDIPTQFITSNSRKRG